MKQLTLPKFKKIASKGRTATTKALKEKDAVPVFTLYLAPVPSKEGKLEDMMFSYFIGGETVIGMGQLIDQIKGAVDNIEKEILKQLDEKK